MGDWTFDILVGWILGSIVGGLVFAPFGAETLGTVVGTGVGIYWMRRRRSDELEEEQE